MVADRQILNGHLLTMIGFIDAVIWRHIYWRLPAQVAYGLLTDKGDAFVGNDAVRLLADEGSVHTLDGQRLVVITVGNLLIFTVLFHILLRILCREDFLTVHDGGECFRLQI